MSRGGRGPGRVAAFWLLAVVNLIAGVAADRLGRRRVLVLGWCVSLPVPALYPLVWAAGADRVPDEARATALGTYRFFRDGGYALGAILAGLGARWLGEVAGWSGVVFLALAAFGWFALGGGQGAHRPPGPRRRRSRPT